MPGTRPEQDVFTLTEAAWGFLDLDPQPGPEPPEVAAMRRRIESAVPLRHTDAFSMLNHPTYERRELLAWSQQIGLYPKFLFPYGRTTDKPPYPAAAPAWSKMATFTLNPAAWLCLGREPDRRPLADWPADVRQMRERIEGGVFPRAFARSYTFVDAPRVHPHELVQPVYDRRDLRQWCQEEGFYPPFLFPQEKPAPPALPRCLVPMRAPATKDDWFYAIRDAVRDFEREKGYTPNEAQVWARLIRTAPGDYGIEVIRNSEESVKELVMPDGKPMDRRLFSKRFARLYPDL